MNNSKEKINKLLLNPKKEKLISNLETTILCKAKNYIPEIANPEYFEIWFYAAFDFKYIILGKENFVIDVRSNGDEKLIEEIFSSFKADFDSFEKAEEEFSKLKQDLEFKFFSNCWEDLEKRTNKRIRCFLIEAGIIRGIDVNKRVRIDGEKIGDILSNEGILNHY